MLRHQDWYLGGAETELLFKQIERLKADGVGLIYISHRLEEIRKISDRIVVMRDGDKVQEFDSGNVPVRTIVESMVGRSLDRMFPALPAPLDELDESGFNVANLSSTNGTFSDVSFHVKKGEIFGIAGLVGAGRTDLVRAIAGVDPIKSGQVTLFGDNITPKSPQDSIRNGVVMVPEDRKLQGLILDHTIANNIGYHQKANEMSGGNQQKVILAKWLAKDPKVVILDEPTRGIDVGARSSIYESIVELAGRGIAVIVVSSDLEEVLGISNRVMVMSQGRATGILDRDAANDVSVMELATK